MWTRAILAFPSNPRHRGSLESVYNCFNYEIIFIYSKRSYLPTATLESNFVGAGPKLIFGGLSRSFSTTPLLENKKKLKILLITLEDGGVLWNTLDEICIGPAGDLVPRINTKCVSY